MKLVGQLPLGRGAQPINVGVQRPSVNLRQAENSLIQAQSVTGMTPMPTFSKHGTFGPKRVTHPGFEGE